MESKSRSTQVRGYLNKFWGFIYHVSDSHCHVKSRWDRDKAAEWIAQVTMREARERQGGMKQRSGNSFILNNSWDLHKPTAFAMEALVMTDIVEGRMVRNGQRPHCSQSIRRDLTYKFVETVLQDHPRSLSRETVGVQPKSGMIQSHKHPSGTQIW
jgi:hypothetical protein